MFTQENQTLYLTTWQYNAALIIEELEKIVTNAGGSVKPARHRGYIENRSYCEAAKEAEMRALRLEAYGKNGNGEKLKNKISELREEAEELKKEAEKSRAAAGNLTYITFILNGKYYYMQFDENPFFDFFYQKTKVNERNERSRDIYLEKLDKKWLHDCFIMLSMQKPEIAEDRKEAANIIFNILTSAKESEKAIDTYRKRVPNYYNNGYHYETVREKERFEKIDF